VARHLPVDRLEDSALPVHVVATDVLSGLEVVLSSGDPVAATSRRLDAGNHLLPHPERFLSLHRHIRVAPRTEDAA
jgi:hypothetical protein